MIRHDKTSISVVTTCTKCAHWSAFSFSLAEAEEREINHNMLFHNMERSVASQAVWKRRQRRRRAEPGRNVQ
jgi:hypothetical protein